MFKVPEKYRLKGHSKKEDGNNGVFYIKYRLPMMVIASDGMNWEHVSVQIIGQKRRCPHWNEMCFIKDLFWDEDDMVIQFHPPKSQYVNVHPYILHLWRPVGANLPLPEKIMV